MKSSIPYAPYVEIELQNNGVRNVLRGAISPQASTTPPDIAEYLRTMGWLSYSTPVGDTWVNEKRGHGYYTWAEAAIATVLKPFLEAK